MKRRRSGTAGARWRLVVAALVLVACRTQLLPPGNTVDDAGPNIGDAAAFTSDLASSLLVDAAGSTAVPDESAPGDRTACGLDVTCDRATEICVYFERGDCSMRGCVPVDPSCAAPSQRTCACMGAAACQSSGSETLTCVPISDENTIECQSNIQCV